jgi:hypothetical protein
VAHAERLDDVELLVEVGAEVLQPTVAAGGPQTVLVEQPADLLRRDGADAVLGVPRELDLAVADPGQLLEDRREPELGDLVAHAVELDPDLASGDGAPAAVRPGGRRRERAGHARGSHGDGAAGEAAEEGSAVESGPVHVMALSRLFQELSSDERILSPCCFETSGILERAGTGPQALVSRYVNGPAR